VRFAAIQGTRIGDDSGGIDESRSQPAQIVFEMNRSTLFDIYAFLFARKRLYRLNRGLFHASIRGMGVLNHKDRVVSGERSFLIGYLASIDKPVVLDVGANVGDFSAEVLSANANALIYAFEPHPETFGRLAARFAERKNLTPVNAACGSSHGDLTLYDFEESVGSSKASLHAGVIAEIHRRKHYQRDVKVVDLDTQCAERDISEVHLLKVDTEGHELEVLKGAERLIRENRIKAIQFEFNEMNVISRVFFKDFIDLLPNYRFFRMLRDGLVPTEPYAPLWCELFAFQNIIALPKN
jgi:FkbM family methyltransferase